MYNETYNDCVRKRYAYVGSMRLAYFLQRERAFHEYWDNMTQSHTVVNIPYEDLARPHKLKQHLLVLRDSFFPEITSSSASTAVALFPYQSRSP